jgi:hypothetical protein
VIGIRRSVGREVTGQFRAMTTPEPNETTAPPSLPEPRDIALEMETPEQAEEMEAQSSPERGTTDQEEQP